VNIPITRQLFIIVGALYFAGYAGWGYWRGEFPGGLTRWGTDVDPTTRREDPTQFWIKFLAYAGFSVYLFAHVLEGK
jgi:hypothetical protein